MVVLDEVNADPIESVLHFTERCSVLDGWWIRHETEVPR